jgi:hypothetical protein
LSFQFQNEGLSKIETPRISEEYENQFLGAEREREREREREKTLKNYSQSYFILIDDNAKKGCKDQSSKILDNESLKNGEKKFMNSTSVVENIHWHIKF